MNTTNVFERNVKAFNNRIPIIVNQGGQGSSKTISILQFLYILSDNSTKPLFITISSFALPHLKDGAMKDFDMILTNEGIYPDNVRNRSESKYFIGKSEIEFVGIEGNEAKATGPRRDILFMNEANRRIKWEIFDLMNSRTHLCTFIDYNPCAEFWFHDKIVPNFQYELIKSTYLDNPYLPERELNNILMKKDKPGFENWWLVYGLGELGRLEGAILQNWKYGAFDETLTSIYGLDFGSKHPDAMVKVAVDRSNHKLYWKEELYKNGLSTGQLGEIIKSRNVGNKLIVADSAAPRTILDLKGQGLNCQPVVKGLINDDIKMLLDWEIIVDPDSTNLAHNLNYWQWLDKKGEVPMDEEDDLIDAGRYASRTLIKPMLTQIGHKVLKYAHTR
jgi:phage terminase large subunit